MEKKTKVSDGDAEVAQRLGITFYITQQEDKGKPYQTVIENIALPDEAIQQARKLTAWHTVVYTSEGYKYWSSQNPDFVNSDVIKQGKHSIVDLDHFEMNWVVFLRANRKEKAEKFLNRMRKQLKTDLKVEDCQRYFKDPALFRISFMTRLNVQNISQAVFLALGQCQRILPRWTVGGPTSYEGEQWEFSGSSKDEATGIVAIDFNLTNFRHVWSGELFNPSGFNDPLALQAQDEWEARVLSMGIDCGISLDDQAVSSEELYE
jgi:hypothetical protein